MTCDELKALLIDDFRGTGDREAVEAHLAACTACRDEAASLESVWDRLGTWPDERPDPSLERRFLDDLHRADLLPPPYPGVWGASAPFVGAAVALALVAIGAWIGVWYATPETPAPDSRAEFVLFLYDDPVAEAANSPEDVRRIVEEYKTWARGLARDGRLVGGEKLTDERRLFGAVSGSGPVVPGGVSLGGYFVIRAGSAEEAAAIAAGCPHLSHGGTIELRRIDPV